MMNQYTHTHISYSIYGSYVHCHKKKYKEGKGQKIMSFLSVKQCHSPRRRALDSPFKSASLSSSRTVAVYASLSKYRKS